MNKSSGRYLVLQSDFPFVDQPEWKIVAFHHNPRKLFDLFNQMMLALFHCRLAMSDEFSLYATLLNQPTSDYRIKMTIDVDIFERMSLSTRDLKLLERIFFTTADDKEYIYKIYYEPIPVHQLTDDFEVSREF